MSLIGVHEDRRDLLLLEVEKRDKLTSLRSTVMRAG